MFVIPQFKYNQMKAKIVQIEDNNIVHTMFFYGGWVVLTDMATDLVGLRNRKKKMNFEQCLLYL